MLLIKELTVVNSYLAYSRNTIRVDSKLTESDIADGFIGEYYFEKRRVFISYQ